MTKYQAIAKQMGSKLVIIIGLAETDVLATYRTLNVPAGTLCLVELSPDDVRSTGCQFWGPRWTRGPMVTDVRALQAENRFVMYWTIDDPTFIDLYLRQAKPNGILTDRPGLVFHRFQTLGTLPPKERPLP
jgi:glycerophosphoryl diester phosphodiesterase